jgi:hypothetical protein
MKQGAHWSCASPGTAESHEVAGECGPPPCLKWIILLGVNAPSVHDR